jgi:hypothetical protein
MKRLVICYDGTWNAVNNPDEVTNVVRVAQAVKSVDSKGIQQIVYYNAGVGSGGPIDRFAGGVFGAGLRDNVKRGLAFLALNWDPPEPGNETGDEIYIFGFSRGAYTARALAGVLGAIGGVPQHTSFSQLGEIWDHYRKRKGKFKQEWIYPRGEIRNPLIKCVAVWDTVGSYGIPAGLGLGALARYFTSWTKGFHDNEIGPDIENGLHAMAIDEWRRAFPATAWVTTKDVDRQGVEQVWFSGSHSNIGGGYRTTGLSDLSLIWMISRVSRLGLEFEDEHIQKYFWPCAACSLYRSNRGWLISGLLPSRRVISRRSEAPGKGKARLINAKVHWSARDRQNKRALVDEKKYSKYRPRNLPKDADVAEPCETERRLHALCRANPDHERRKTCALHRDDTPKGWFAGWRARRLRELRQEWIENKPDLT